MNRFGEIVLRCSPRMTDAKSIDPVIHSLQGIIELQLLKKKSGRPFQRVNYRYNDKPPKSKNTINVFTWKFKDGNFSIVYQTSKSQFYINGIKLNKADIMTIISKLVYKTCFTRNSTDLYKYLNQLIILPPNVMYCVENRTPYSFWDVRPDHMQTNSVRGKKYSVTLNTQIISETECALEISENIWATIKIKDLNQFINYHKFDKQRSKKWALMPENLWCALFGSMPSYSQMNLMYSFLQQNRTQDRIEERAQQLLVDLTKEHPNKIYKFKNKTASMFNKKGSSNCLFVKGVLCDWVLIPNHSRTMHQKVNAYKIEGVFKTLSETKSKSKRVTLLSIVNPRKELPIAIMALTGPICIDTLHGNSSEGDQMASRALALMNDELTSKYIKTLRPYLIEESAMIADTPFRQNICSRVSDNTPAMVPILESLLKFGATTDPIKEGD
tara:strand:- start:2843 stop:4168 length:1326 start_codon:yes stop_codon:yes gene_type:complete